VKAASAKADEAAAADPEDADAKLLADTLKPMVKTSDEVVTVAEEVVLKKLKMGVIIGGVAAAVVLVGGCVYYKKKQGEDAEGGQKEDKKLFKNTFKGNVVKKVQKEALVPTFAVPAEENI
jgi:hypothetical protein